MSLQDWVFSLHLVFAATLVGGLFMSWIVAVALWTADDPEATLDLSRVLLVSTCVIAVGLPGVIAVGVWLAELRPELRPWHGWAIAAVVLWAIAAVAISCSVFEYAKSKRKARALLASGARGPSAELLALNRTQTGLLCRVVASLAIVLIVIDMVYKPGA